MHGLVHLAARAFVIDSRDEAAWSAALCDAGVMDERAFLDAVMYPDAATMSVLRACARSLGLDFATALEGFGAFVVRWLAEMGHMHMLDAMGPTLTDLLRNLNALHHTLARTHRDAHFPTLDVEGDANDGTLVISYASSRGELLAPLAAGVLRAIALLKARAPLQLRRLDKPRAGYVVTWACTLGPELVPPRDAPDVSPRAERERRMARGWHQALVESCCGGRPPAQSAEEPRRGLANRLASGWWSNRARAVQPQPTAAAVDADANAGRRAPDPSSRAAVGAPAARWVPLRKLSLARRVSPAQSRESQRSSHSRRGLTNAKLDELLLALPSLADPGAALMRAVRCGEVGASLDDAAQLVCAAAFWRSNAGSVEDYELSAPAESAARFVSHTWQQPTDWHAMMGAACEFADVKAVVLAMAARDFVFQRRRLASRARMLEPGDTALVYPPSPGSRRGQSAADSARLAQQPAPIERWEDVTLWIDKCCVAQQHPIMVPTIALLDQFVRRCEGMIVLFTWDFFERLWCVYEWALFLVLHDAEHVQLCVDVFLNERTLPRYVEAIRGFTFARARTYYENDVQLVRQRVEAMYHSIEHFERFVQLAAIVHVAVEVAKRTCIAHSDARAEAELRVWVQLAAELGFAQLAEALARARPAEWFERAAGSSARGADERARWVIDGKTWRAHLAGRVDSWYRRELKQLVGISRKRCVRPEFVELKSPSPLASADWTAAAQRAYSRHAARGSHAGAGAPPSVVAPRRERSTETLRSVDERAHRLSEEATYALHADVAAAQPTADAAGARSARGNTRRGANVRFDLKAFTPARKVSPPPTDGLSTQVASRKSGGEPTFACVKERSRARIMPHSIRAHIAGKEGGGAEADASAPIVTSTTCPCLASAGSVGGAEADAEHAGGGASPVAPIVTSTTCPCWSSAGTEGGAEADAEHAGGGASLAATVVASATWPSWTSAGKEGGGVEADEEHVGSHKLLAATVAAAATWPSWSATDEAC